MSLHTERTPNPYVYGPTTVFVEAFGRRLPASDANGRINAEEEDLYSVFHARSILMSWYGADRATERPMAWVMHEAEITADTGDPGPGGSRIGYVQVGLLAHGAEIVLRLPALIQCFHDALCWFGDVNLSAIQITAASLVPHHQSCLTDLISSRNWFDTIVDTIASDRVNAVIAFDEGSLDNHAQTKPFARLQSGVGRHFIFGPLSGASESQHVALPVEMLFPVRNARPSDVNLPVALPEWTPGAIGWALAAAVDAVSAASPGLRTVIARITRAD